MKVPKEEYGLIENILNLLSHPDRPAPSLPDLRAARGIIRFMDEMPGGFLIYHAGGEERIVYANKALLRLFQCETMEQFTELTGGTFRGMVHPEDVQAVEQSIEQQIAISQFDLDYVEYRIICRDGTIRWVDDYGHFIHTPSSGALFYVFIGDSTEKRARQLSERAALMQEKQQNEQKLHSLICSYNEEKQLIHQEHLRQLEIIEGLGVNYESILYADLDADTVSPYRLSTRTRKQFDEKFQTRSFLWYAADYVHTWVCPEDRELVSRVTSPAVIRQQLKGNQVFTINYRVFYGQEMQYIQLRIVDVTNHTENGDVSQVVLGYRRVDDEFRHEIEQKQALEKALEQARLAIVAKNTFLSNMSHDMRTPLNAIFGFTALAKKHLGNTADALGYLNRIEAASNQLLELIDKVLELSWSESQESAEEIPFSLDETVQEVHQFLQPQAAEKNISFTLDRTSLQHERVYGDPDGLKQVLLYLGNNAVTYTPQGGQASILVREQPDETPGYALYQFIVKDNGIGVSKEFLQHIFEPFEREKNTTLSGIHGAGLGLAIAQNIVERMQGEITAQSEEGRGSIFTVSLRMRMQEQAAPPLADSGNAPLPPLKLLLVEDNAINQEIETELLGELGFTVDTAADGRIALEKVSQSQPGDYDLILMDIQMPVMDGWQAARAIRALPDPALSQIPIIAVSANAFQSDRQASLESGMQAHLPKPLDIPQLLGTIAEVLQLR